jgi:hypothetical protein
MRERRRCERADQGPVEDLRIPCDYPRDFPKHQKEWIIEMNGPWHERGIARLPRNDNFRETTLVPPPSHLIMPGRERQEVALQPQGRG